MNPEATSSSLEGENNASAPDAKPGERAPNKVDLAGPTGSSSAAWQRCGWLVAIAGFSGAAFYVGQAGVLSKDVPPGHTVEAKVTGTSTRSTEPKGSKPGATAAVTPSNATSSSSPSSIEIIAILPFAGSVNEWNAVKALGDQLLIDTRLRLIPAAEVAKLPAKVTPQEAGKLLGAQAVLGGRYAAQQFDQDVVEAELLEVTSGLILWREVFVQANGQQRTDFLRKAGTQIADRVNKRLAPVAGATAPKLPAPQEFDEVLKRSLADFTRENQKIADELKRAVRAADPGIPLTVVLSMPNYAPTSALDVPARFKEKLLEGANLKLTETNLQNVHAKLEVFAHPQGGIGTRLYDATSGLLLWTGTRSPAFTARDLDELASAAKDRLALLGVELARREELVRREVKAAPSRSLESLAVVQIPNFGVNERNLPSMNALPTAVLHRLLKETMLRFEDGVHHSIAKVHFDARKIDLVASIAWQLEQNDKRLAVIAGLKEYRTGLLLWSDRWEVDNNPELLPATVERLSGEIATAIKKRVEQERARQSAREAGDK